MEQLQQEVEQSRAEVNNKSEDYDRKKLMLKTVLDPDMFKRAEDYIANRNAVRWQVLLHFRSVEVLKLF